ncbi:MAG: tetratricopeptide repeat protein [Chloroflexota bacterium]
MDQLSIELLGTLSLKLNGQPIDRKGSRKGTALLLYLAVTQRPQRREQVADLLWDADSTRQSLSNLRTALTRLRRTLGGDYIQSDDDWLRLPPTLQAWVDVNELQNELSTNDLSAQIALTEFNQLSTLNHPSLPKHAGPEHAGQSNTQAQFDKLETVLALYTGKFLDGFTVRDAPRFNEWLDQRREKLHTDVIKTHKYLSMVHLDRGNWAAGLRIVERWLALEPLDEQAFMQKMRFFAYTGQQRDAIETFEAYQQQCQRELNSEPSPEITALFEAIRTETLRIPVHLARYSTLSSSQVASISTPQPSQPAHLSYHRYELEQTVSSLVKQHKHNLPAQVNSFHGRAEEIEEIQRYFSTGSNTEPSTRAVGGANANQTARLVTIVGEGGMGKSRLALAVAETLIQQPEANARFPDGIWFVPLASVTEADTLATSIATLLGIYLPGQTLSHVSTPIQSSVQSQVIEALRHLKVLLILDNFEQLMNASPFVAELLQKAPRVCLLLTSREVLRSQAEQVIRLSGLPVPPPPQRLLQAAQEITTITNYPSIQLFAQRAQRHVPQFSLLQAETDGQLAQVIQICQLVDGSPLGIELAAAWIEYYTLPEIIAALQEKDLDFLVVDHVDVPDRHRSLRNVFESSWSLLTPESRQALAQLSIFRGNFQRDAALQITDATMRDLVSLVNKSLLRQTRLGHFEMHELLRQYSQEKLPTIEQSIVDQATVDQATTQSSDQSIPQRHSDYYLHFIGQQASQLRGRESKKAADTIQEAIDNIRIAWQWAIQHQQLFLIDEGLDGLHSFYSLKNLVQEGNVVFGQARETFLSLVNTTDNTASNRQALTTLRLMNCHSNLLIRCNQPRDAIQICEDALQRVQQLTEHPDVTPELFMRLQQIMAMTYLQWGNAHAQQADYEIAVDYFERGLFTAQHAQATYVTIMCHARLGLTLYNLGLLDKARDHLMLGLAESRRAQDCQAESEVMGTMATVAWYQDDYEQSLAYYREAVQLKHILGDRRGEGLILGNMGLSYLYLGDYAEARRCFENALEMRRDTSDQLGVGFALTFLSALSSYEEEFDTALAYVQESLNIARTMRSQNLEASALLDLGIALEGLGDFVGARDAYERGLILRRQLNQPHLALDFRAGLARVALAYSEVLQAMVHIRAIFDYLDQSSIQGSAEPFRIYLSCYHVLRAARDNRANRILSTAYVYLREQAGKIQDGKLRQMFLEKVAIHREIASLARKG